MNRRHLVQRLSMSMLSPKLLTKLYAHGQTTESSSDPKRPVSANDHVNVGVIGPGSRGLELTRQLLRTAGVKITAVCDVYEPRFTQVNDLVGEKVPAYRNYRELLARKDIDAIFVATPPVFHAEHVIASIESGRPVYGEKTLAFKPEDCHRVVEIVSQHKQIFQIGHQYRYASWYQEAINRVHRGDIGEPTHVYGYWHRSDNWRRPVPAPNLEHLLNWRLYRESSGGLFEELGSHHIEVANWVFGEHPESVLGTTSIAVSKDGRTVGDNVQAVLGYSKGRRMVFSSLSDNAMMGDQLWIFGTEGSVQLTIEDATFYGEKRKDAAIASHSDLIQKGVVTGSSYKTSFAMPYRGPGDRVPMRPGEDPTRTACTEFIRCIRTRQQPFADVHVGYGTAMAAAVGRTAFREEHGVPVPNFKSGAKPGA